MGTTDGHKAQSKLQGLMSAANSADSEPVARHLGMLIARELEMAHEPEEGHAATLSLIKIDRNETVTAACEILRSLAINVSIDKNHRHWSKLFDRVAEGKEGVKRAVKDKPVAHKLAVEAFETIRNSNLPVSESAVTLTDELAMDSNDCEDSATESSGETQMVNEKGSAATSPQREARHEATESERVAAPVSSKVEMMRPFSSASSASSLNNENSQSSKLSEIQEHINAIKTLVQEEAMEERHADRLADQMQTLLNKGMEADGVEPKGAAAPPEEGAPGPSEGSPPPPHTPPRGPAPPQKEEMGHENGSSNVNKAQNGSENAPATAPPPPPPPPPKKKKKEEEEKSKGSQSKGEAEGVEEDEGTAPEAPPPPPPPPPKKKPSQSGEGGEVREAPSAAPPPSSPPPPKKQSEDTQQNDKKENVPAPPPPPKKKGKENKAAGQEKEASAPTPPPPPPKKETRHRGKAAIMEGRKRKENREEEEEEEEKKRGEERAEPVTVRNASATELGKAQKQVKRRREVVDLFHKVRKRSQGGGTDKGGGGQQRTSGTSQNSEAEKSPGDMLDEIKSRSSHAKEVEEDLHQFKQTLESIAKRATKSEFGTLEEVHVFLDEIDGVLGSLSDEQAVLKHVDGWPEKRVDAMREAVATSKEVNSLLKSVKEAQENVKVPLSRLEEIFSKAKAKMEGLSVTDDSDRTKFQEFHIPWDGSLLKALRVCQFSLAQMHMQRSVEEAERSERTSGDKNETRFQILAASTNFAFKVHQTAGGFDEETRESFDHLQRQIKPFLDNP